MNSHRRMIRNPKGTPRTPDNDDSIGAQFARINAKFAHGRRPCDCLLKPLRAGPPWHVVGCVWAAA